MRFPAFLAQYGRLLAIGLLSLLLHLLLLAWFDNAITSPNVIDADAVQAAPLSLRLAQAVQSAAPTPAAPTDAGPPPVAATPAATSAAVAVEDAAVPVSAATPALPREPALQPAPDEAPVATPASRPRRYQVNQPPAARIDYQVTTGAAARQDAGSAHLDWRSEDQRYHLDMEGVVGSMLSEGGFDDAGIAPERFEERRAGRSYHTVFGREHARPPAGIQDSASVYIQLAGMGRADPDQMQDELTFWIGGPDGGSVQRYQVLGGETIDTGIGQMVTVHLVRPGSAHEARVDVWLAPQQAWLPVQIRVTAPGGAVLTQTLVTIALAPDPG